MSGPSEFGGMGARLLPSGGTSFRVWAPHAEAVSVAGTFCDWDEARHLLFHEGNGYWSGDVANAKYMDGYKYVITHRGQKYRRNDPYAREVTQSNGHSLIIDPSFDWGDEGGYRMPPWHDLVIYEMHLGTFNAPNRGAPGNFDHAIERLHHVASLGISAIKLMPPYEYAGDFSWGYNPAHVFAIESSVGGPKALRRFIRAAHQHGLAVIMDVVYNHLGPSDLDLWHFDGWKLRDDRGGIYFYNDDRAATPWGHTRPDYGRPEVRQFIRDNALFWLEEFRADGLRWDSTSNIRYTPWGENAEGWGLMQWIHDEIRARQPWKLSIAEDLQENEWLTKPTSRGGAGFNSQWAAAFVHPIRDVIIRPDDEERNMYAVRDAIYHRYNGDALSRVIYTESHDEVANGRARVPEEIWPGNADSWYSKKRSTLGAGLVMTSPGIPMIFQGQEMLEDRFFHDQDPIEWDRLTRFSGIVQLYRDLIRLRRNWYDTTAGLRGQHVNVHHINNHDKVVAYHRWDRGGPGDDVIVVANFRGHTHRGYRIGFPREGWWKVRFHSDWSGYDPDFANALSYDTYAERAAYDGMPASANVGVGAYSLLILSLEPPLDTT